MRISNDAFQILIQNAHFELKFKLRTLLSCENSLAHQWHNRPYAYDVTEGRPAALGVK